MRNVAAPVVPIFRSQIQAELLAALYLRPQQNWTLTSLARDLEVAPSTLHSEIHRLVEARLVTVTEIGRSRVLHVNPDHPLVQPVTEILNYMYGPRMIISEEFADIPGIERLLIFGSWAARHAGNPGPPPHDIDILVVGEVDRATLYAAADRTQERIGIPVNPVLSSTHRWDADTDALIRQIKSAPMIDLTADLHTRSEQPAP
ncbi:winged helix-turn-helix domain-containing protein [Streptosporangium sp. NPDC006007]|uniref:winged helix-turn-helix domain-containing protein n=1 Tax=Streptosporangium sp. NPDC006007 TaxID=3154575 RepID=UPI0033A924C3